MARVIVLPDEEIHACIKALAESSSSGIAAGNAEAELTSALEYPGGITPEMVDRAKDAYAHTLVSADPWRAALAAAFFPGDTK